MVTLITLLLKLNVSSYGTSWPGLIKKTLKIQNSVNYKLVNGNAVPLNGKKHNLQVLKVLW